MTAQPLFQTALDAARDWYNTLPEAQVFCPWPDDFTWRDRPARLVPGAQLIIDEPGSLVSASGALIAALQALVPHAEWRLSYTKDEVGEDFLNRYGWFELAGPDGHFISQKGRLMIGYWGSHLFYPRHEHEAEELYTILSGEAIFHADGEADIRVGPGETKFHAASQPHAMTTEDQPVLTFVFWRGDGMANRPSMTT